MTDRELYFRKKKSKLEFTLYLMRMETSRARVTNDPNLELYDTAAECVEKELRRVIKELR